MRDIQTALKNVVKQQFGHDITPELTRPDEQFGDYATNAALQLAGRLGRPPREIAEELAAALKNELPQLKDVAVAGPGFINVTLDDDALLAAAEAAPHAKPQTYKGKVVVAEYSDPNPFKALHAGHLYTTLVGDAISSLLEAAGAKVHRVNYGGDVGLHVARAMWGIIHFLGGEHPEKLADISEAERATWISKRYVEGNAAYEQDETAKAEIIALNKRVYQLHETGDKTSPFAHIYWTCRQWSYDGFDNLYAQLQIHPFERYIPESEVTPPGLEIVKKGLKEGVFAESDGAIVYKGEDEGLHTRVFINSNGLPTYEAKDLGLAATKWRDYKFDLGFIITGNDIVEYMKVIIKALGHFYPEVAERSRHLTHGMIRLPGGKKMSSRKGNNPMAQDILDAAVAANKAATGADDNNVVLAAVKYAFLKYRIGGDMIYNPEESVSLEGDSGPYLQYAHARARSILVKAGEAKGEAAGLDAAERSLARKISEYPEVIAKAVEELMPHHIAVYLYELAQSFNRFYEHNRVVGDPRQTTRQQLVALYADVLKDGLTLLNIAAPERL
ncbi:MAG TPA: arginine--tRNA ligase [Candidatus Saccharimonadales bacterium]|nr:arginine--tRNA ligase [Candidatus Saccharimonadales bacterium]